MQLFGRSVSLRFPGALRDLSGSITYTRGEGPRIAFDFTRSIRAEPDQGTIRVWNLPAEVTDRIAADLVTFKQSLKSVQDTRTGASLSDMERARRLHTVLEQHIVELWAGYGPDAQPIFRGDMIAVRPRVRDGLDYVCEIDVGDGFVALQEQWMAATYGVGETPANLLAFTAALADVDGDDGKMRAAIGLVAPNALTARLSNGWVGTGRPADTIKEIADFLGLYWWVRNGKVEFVRRDQYLPDFAVLLDANSTLMATSLTDDGRYRGFEAVLAPQIHPGRAVMIVDENGLDFRGRVLECKISGDTHGDTWSVSGLCDASTWASLPMTEASTGPRLTITPAEWERQTNPRTGGDAIPKALRQSPR